MGCPATGPASYHKMLSYVVRGTFLSILLVDGKGLILDSSRSCCSTGDAIRAVVGVRHQSLHTSRVGG